MNSANHSHPHYASASLYVGDLDPDVNEMTLYEIFSSIGPVASIRVCRETGTRRSLGYAYVNYQAVNDAERSLDTLNYTPIKGIPCRIMWSHRDPSLRRSGAGNVFVKNLDKIIDNKALHDTFSLFGNILSCKVATDEYGKSKGFGFVHYESDESALAAIEKVNGMQIGSKTVYVGPFKKQCERPTNRAMHFTNIYIRQFPETWTESTVKSVFGAMGEITSFIVSNDSKGRRFALVNYADKSSARLAVDSLHNRLTTPDGLASDDKETDVDESTEAPPSSLSAEKVVEKTSEKVAEKSSEQVADKTSEHVAEKAEEAAEATKEPESKVTGDTKEIRLYVVRAVPRAERMAAFKESYTSNIANEAKAKSQQGVNLYVKNLDEKVTDEELKEAFAKFGTVTSAKVMKDDNGVSKGFGFVCFAFPEEATKAVTAMHLRIFHNKPLYVGLAERRDSRVARLKARYRMSNNRPAPNHPMMVQPQPISPQVMGGYSTGQGAPPVFYGQQVGTARPPQGGQPPYASVVPAGVDPMLWRQQQQQQQRQYRPPGGPLNPMTPGYPYQITPGLLRGNQPPQQAPSRLRPAMNPSGNNQQNFKFTPQARNQQEFPQTTNVSHATGDGILLTAQALASLHPQMQKQILGERLFPLVTKHQPELAGKITGMMLEMDNTELLALLESEALIQAKVNEALGVLHRHHKGGAAPSLANPQMIASATAGGPVA